MGVAGTNLPPPVRLLLHPCPALDRTCSPRVCFLRSPYFVTDPERMVCEYENCKVLLVDKKISTARDIIGILEAAIRCVGVGGWGSVGLGGLMGV